MKRVAENWLFRQSDKYVRTLYKYRQSVYVYSGLFAIGTSGKSSFWTEPYSEWTNLKAWKGVDVGADKALRKG